METIAIASCLWPRKSCQTQVTPIGSRNSPNKVGKTQDRRLREDAARRDLYLCSNLRSLHLSVQRAPSQKSGYRLYEKVWLVGYTNSVGLDFFCRNQFFLGRTASPVSTGCNAQMVVTAPFLLVPLGQSLSTTKKSAAQMGFHWYPRLQSLNRFYPDLLRCA